MRCLYCGEPLSLLRKLTGKAEFCSEAHREAYQDEFNHLALQRLASRPKQNLRPIPLPEPEVPKVGAVESGESEFSDDADEFAPIFDSPIFRPINSDLPEELPAHWPMSVVTAASNEPPPPPLWGLLADTGLRAAGEVPDRYTFPLWLEDYPRPQLMPPVAWLQVVEVPFGPYLDLPTPLDDLDKCDSAIPPAGYFAASIAWQLVGTEFGSFGERVAPRAALLPLTSDLASSDAAAPCALPPPRAHRFAVPAPASPAAIAYPAGSSELAHAASALQFEGNALELELENESLPAWSTAVGSMAHAQRQDHVYAAALAIADRLEVDAEIVPSAETIAAAPVCEAFDAERTLVPPHLEARTRPGLALTGILHLPVSAGPAGDSASTGSPLAFAVTGRLCQPTLHDHTSAFHIPCAGLVEFSFALLQSSPELAPGGEQLPWSLESPTALATAVVPVTVRHLASAAAAGISSSPLALATEVSVNDWVSFPAHGYPSPSATASLRHPVVPAAAFYPLHGQPCGFAPSDDVAVEPVRESTSHLSSPAPWRAAPLARCGVVARPVTPLAKVVVKDLTWPEFAAGCDSLFTPDQPFRFHELPFPPRGTTESTVGEALRGKIMEGLLLLYSDERFESILHPALAPEVVENWLDAPATPEAPSTVPLRTPLAAVFVPEEAKPSPPPVTVKFSEPPISWQQAARAMYEGEQQVQREPVAKPVEGKVVYAVPVDPHPVTGLELTRMATPQPPALNGPREPLGNDGYSRTPASDQPQFEWRRDQPQPAPATSNQGSTVSVNTTIVVEGNADGVVIENAVRISLGGGQKKKKTSAVEKFTEGEDLGENRIEIAPVEGLPEFTADVPELRAILHYIPSAGESVQWPKFSVTPMRRRIAFGPPPRGNFFGGTNGNSHPKTAEAKPLPPKKTVGFLFKKLTNS